jgi:quercetin dioxygenase-like cupin family protein
MKGSITVRSLIVLAAMVSALTWTATQADDKGHGADAGHVVVRMDDIKWGPAPPALPAGAQAAIIAGDPGKSGPYVIRAKFPDGYKVPPHWHPTDENVTVLKGTFMAGKGEKFNADSAEALPAGSFVCMPKGMRHFAFAKGETIIQVHGMGPFEITYVNPSDDPRKK